MYKELPRCKHMGRAHHAREIKLTIHVRRRPGHDRIPEHHEYIGCKPRPRLSVEEFGRRYGSCDDDVHKVKTFALTHGLKVHGHHHARRHVTVSGTVAQLEAAFQVELHDYYKGRPFHFPNLPPTLPDHLADIIVHVGLGLIPLDVTGGVYVVPNSTDHPPNAPQGATNTAITPAQVAALYDCPLDGTGQTCAILIEDIIFDSNNSDQSPTPIPTGLHFGYSRNDVALTMANWGSPMPNIIDISIDGVISNQNTSPNGEWNGDICMASGFAPGADIAVYFAGSAGFVDGYARIVHPQAGDPICHTLSLSANYRDEATWFRDSPTLVPIMEQILEDAALQSITVPTPTQDLGSGGGIGDGKAHAPGSTFAGNLSVGGTTIGNINGSSFTEWLWNQSQVGAESFYRVGAGGGASAYVPIPSYQQPYTFSKSLNNGFPGRSVPDIAAIAAQQYTIFLNGQAQGFGGVSQSTPSVNGMLASINKAVGYPIGFINPTLYAFGSEIVRNINPANTVGGPQSNKGGMFTDAQGNTRIDPNVPGYPVDFNFDCCNGLGVLMGNKLVAVLQRNPLYHVFEDSATTASNQALAMLYWNHLVYYQDIQQNWFQWATDNTHWIAVGADPRSLAPTPPVPPPVPSPSPTPSALPNPPSNIVFSLATSTSIVVNWTTDNLSNTYVIGLKISTNTQYQIFQSDTTTTFNFQGLTPGTSYDFEIAAKNANGATSAFTVAQFTTPTAVAPVTWNPNDKSQSVNLTNGNLTASSNGGVQQSVRSTVGYTSGKYFFEIRADVWTKNTAMGISTLAYNLAPPDGLGGDPTGAAFRGATIVNPQGIFRGDPLQGIVGNGQDINGDTVSIALDATNRLIWFSSPVMRSQGLPWNDNANSDPASGRNGLDFTVIGQGPWFATFNDNLGGALVTANFGLSPFTIPIPNGFQPYQAGATGIGPSPTPSPSGSASANGTYIDRTVNGAIIDLNGETVTLVQTNGGQVAFNGQTDTTTANVVRIVYISSLVYQQNAALNWWFKVNSFSQWVQVSDPTIGVTLIPAGPVTPTPAPVPTPGPAPSPSPGPISGVSPLIQAPLVGAVPGQWKIINFSGNGIQTNYCLLLPHNYSPSFSYPLFLYLHENGYGNDQSGNFVLYNYESQGQGGDIWFNNTIFRTKYPSIVVIPMVAEDQDSSGNTQNWGGWGGPNPQPSQLNVITIIKQLMTQYSIYPKKMYVTGDSLGGIGTWEFMIQYNAQTGFTTGSRLFTAGWSESGGTVLYGDPPNQNVVNSLRNVPMFAVRGAGDNGTAPDWDIGLYNAYGGGNSSSFPPSKAPNGNFRYINDPNLPHDVWGVHRNLSPNFNGGDTSRAQYILDWLFSQTSP